MPNEKSVKHHIGASHKAITQLLPYADTIFVNICIIAFLTFTISCTAFKSGLERAAIGASLVKSPVVYRVSDINHPISIEDRIFLEKLSDQYKTHSDRFEVAFDKHVVVLKPRSGKTNETFILKTPLTHISNITMVINALRDTFTSGTAIIKADNNLSEDDREYMIEAFSRVRDKLSAERIRHVMDYYDDYNDLVEKNTIVILCFSGGGSRAAAFASHCMALLEQAYNARLEKDKDKKKPPLIDMIDAYSSVSGGSLLSCQIAIWHRWSGDQKSIGMRERIAKFLFPAKPTVNRRFAFQQINTESLSAQSPLQIGYLSATNYFSPFNLFIPPLLLTFTNYSYLDYMSDLLVTSLRHNVLFGDLSIRPRFYFNATCMETGAPFVFTQAMIHYPDDEIRMNTIRSDLQGQMPHDLVPLISSLTLEDLNSSPALFPIAKAAMASSAFPFALRPAELRKFGFLRSKMLNQDGSENQQAVYATNETIHVADGGLYDNSGLSTAVDIMDYAVRHPKSKIRRAILVNINADNSSSYRDVIHNISYIKKTIPLRIMNPFRGLASGAKNIDYIHYMNKRRAETIAWGKIERLAGDLANNNRMVEISYFPINLAQLSESDEFNVSGASNLYELVSDITTDFILSPDDDRVLDQAARVLITTNQRHVFSRS